MKPMIQEHNVMTNEIIEREMTDEEFEAHKIAVANMKKLRDEEETRSKIRQSALAKLTALGLTEEEISVL